jgi:hypothetical protein
MNRDAHRKPTLRRRRKVVTALHGAALVALACLACELAVIAAASFSLARDFSYTDNRTNSLWSYRLDDSARQPPAFPLLTLTNRDANALWGSDFPTPPAMWCEATGYWGIGRNVSGKELFSSRNGATWRPGEVLFHPKAGAAPSRLVVAWTAPGNLVIDVHCVLGRAAEQGNGIGYSLLKRGGSGDVAIVSLKNIGESLTNEVTGIGVAQGDQLFFRFDTCGDPGGDISRADIRIQGEPVATAGAMAARPYGGTVMAGSDFTFSVAETGAASFHWSPRSIPPISSMPTGVSNNWSSPASPRPLSGAGGGAIATGWRWPAWPASSGIGGALSRVTAPIPRSGALGANRSARWTCRRSARTSE